MTEQINTNQESENPMETLKSIKAIFESSLEHSSTYPLSDKTPEAQETKKYLEAFLNSYFGEVHFDLDKRTVSSAMISSGEFETLAVGRVNLPISKVNNSNTSSEDNTGLYFLLSQDFLGQARNMTIFFSDGNSAIPGNEVAIYSISETENGLGISKL
jgi:hypothetical protein